MIKTKKSALLAWSLFAVITVIALFNLAEGLTNRPDDANLFMVISYVQMALVMIEFSFLAALIVSRQPRNVIGWLMVLPALAFVIDFLAVDYLEQFSTAPTTPTAPLLLAGWYNGASWLLLIFPLLFTMLLFPDGRPPSPRWRWVLWAGLGMVVFFIFYVLFSPTLTLIENEDWMVTNPIGFLPAGFEFPVTAWAAGLVVLTLFCAAAPFIRYRRAAGVEREQIKWLFYACGLFALVYTPMFFASDSETVLPSVWEIFFWLAIMAVPAAIAIAILRYRLWDIDLIVRRTLIYGVLTAVLVLIYFGSVVLLQSVFSAVSGQQSPVAVVISTLAIAALFNPLRRRLQAVIDRRFFRRKYDAAQTLAQFALTARDEVDLDALTAELVRVVNETMQPERVTLWLKGNNAMARRNEGAKD